MTVEGGGQSLANTPITCEEWPNIIPEVKAKRTRRRFELSIAGALTSANLVKNARLSRSKGRMQVLLKTNQVGGRFFPTSIKTTALDEEKVRRRRLDEKRLSGFRPDHLAMRPLPKQLPKELHVARGWMRPEGQEDDLGEPGTIFAPDTRYVFSDTSFPWCTCGRVQVEGDWGSGVMIGPRHMMTASHVINWRPNNRAGWVKFTPLQFDTSEPFGFAHATRIYSWQQVNDSDGVSSNEAAFDYVVCVLDRRIGDITGWMGSREYLPKWNGGSYWAHVGYPGDTGGGLRPIFHGDGIMDSTISEPTAGRNSFRIMHRNDYWGGQSGGPAFGWWDNEEWPRVVAIYSAINWGMAGGPNANGGGSPLPELINYARTVEP